MSKKIPLSSLLVLLAFSTCAFAQKNEVSLVVGGAVSPAMSDTLSMAINNALCPINQPNCGLVPSSSKITTKVESRVFFEGAFARRILDGHAASVYIELPLVVVPSRDIKDSFGNNFSSIFLVPSLKVKIRPLAGLSPFFSAGAGVAHFNTELPSLVASAGSNKWATQFGAGMDINTPIHPLAFRLEACDYITGAPRFNSFSIFQHPLHNVLIGGGIVLRF
jgi:hypothetical protein